MTTTINSNGSKWAGQAPDTVADLLKVLSSHPLDRTFEEYGNFIIADKDMWHFFGNFLTVSHVFSIDTDDRETIDSLTVAIRCNQTRRDYQSQPDPVAVREARARRAEELRRSDIEKRKSNARHILEMA